MLRSSSACSSTGLSRASSGLGVACAEVCSPKEPALVAGVRPAPDLDCLSAALAHAHHAERLRRTEKHTAVWLVSGKAMLHPGRAAHVCRAFRHITPIRLAVASNYALLNVH